MNFISYITYKYKQIERNFMKLDHPYFYVFVRTDLSLTDQIIQAAHVAHSMGVLFSETSNQVPSLVLIGAENKEELEIIINKLISYNIKFATFYEPDNDKGLTAVATEPLLDKKKRNKLMKYRLWKPPVN